jgi:hypothetical protein
MKKQIFSKPFYATKKFIFGFGLTGFLLIGSTSGIAAQDSVKKDPNPAIRYIGSLGGQPVFNVAFETKNRSIYYLTITDEEGTLLYSEKIKGSQFSKNFKFDGADHNHVKLTFALEGDKTKQTEVFKVDTNVEVSKDVVVTNLR